MSDTKLGLKWEVWRESEGLLERERTKNMEAKQRRETNGKSGILFVCSLVAMAEADSEDGRILAFASFTVKMI